MKTSWFRRIALTSVVVAVALVAALLPAGPAPARAQDAPTNTMGNSIAAALGMMPSNTNRLSRTLTATNAAGAWAEVEQASTRPPIPDAWQLQEPSPDEQSRYFLPYVLALADKSHEFYTRYSTDTNASDARQRELAALSAAIEQFGATNLQTRFDAAEKTVLADPTLTEDDRFAIRLNDIKKAEQEKEKDTDNDVAMLAVFESGTRTLQKEFPNQPEVLDRLMTVADLSDPDKSRAIVKEVSGNTNAPAELKDAATEMAKKLDRVGKTLPLQFDAMDNRPVDLAKMGGKVVLVDFWATWCQPCMEEFPSVKKAYDQYHTKGLEIVGINLDQEKDSLTNFVALQKVEWPQYFDGKYWETKYATNFGIKEIPAMWLVDKKGVLRYINAGFDLTNKVERLLAE